MDSTYSLTPKIQKILRKTKKSLNEEFQKHQDEILNNPMHGKVLKGDLKGFYSYDFKFEVADLRICYVYQEADNHVNFVYFGTRQNFYEDVKRYI